jgi:ribosomal protein S12 methylthiotransferase
LKVFILTLGCPKNIVDSERLAGQLLSEGHEILPEPEGADLIILNTCAFISEAEEEAKNYIKRLVKIAPVAAIGCLPARRPRARRVYGPAPRETDAILALAGRIFRDPDEGTRLLDPYPYAYLKVAEGCSRRCSFCVIPLIRGRLRSRRKDDLLEEARALVELGKKEIILVAQETTQFGRDTGERLEDLLAALDRIEGDFWLRLMYIHPGGMTRSLASTLASLDHLVPYIHMPVQHLSDRVLRAMGRAGGERAVRRSLSLIRKYLPDAFLRTEVMVGFPGETDEDFRSLADGIASGLFQRVAVFPFYRERGSRAWAMKALSRETISERYAEAQNLARALHIRVQKGLVGKELRLLVDEPGLARTVYDAPEVDFSVRIPKGLAPGNFLKARISSVDGEGDLEAVIS